MRDSLPANMQRVLNALRHQNCEPRDEGPEWRGPCPLHADDPSSLSVTLATTGAVLLACRSGCMQKNILRALNLSLSDTLAGASNESVELSQSSSPSAAMHREPVDDPIRVAAEGVVRLSDVTVTAVSWLWNGRLALGELTVLDGDPGVGKSQIVAEIAACVSTGRPLPGGSIDVPSQVLLVDYENDLARTLAPRVHAAAGDGNLIFWLDHDALRAPLDLAAPTGPEALERRVRETGAALVVIDPLVAALGPSVDTFKDQSVRRPLLALRTIAQRNNCAVLVVRHLNKAQVGKAIYRGGGSIGIVATARLGLLLAEAPHEVGARVLASEKNNLGPKPPSLKLVIEQTETGAPAIRWHGELAIRADELVQPAPREDAAENDAARDFILEVLADGAQPAGAVLQQARQRGISERSLRRAQRALRVVSTPVPKQGGRGMGAWSWSLPIGDGDQLDQLDQPREPDKLIKLIDEGAISGGPDATRSEMTQACRLGGADLDA